MPICPWCRIRNPAFPQDTDPTLPQTTQPPAPPLRVEEPVTLVKSTQENNLVTPAVQKLVYAPQPLPKSKGPPKRTNGGQFGQPHHSVTTTPVVGTHVSQARVFSQQQVSSASSKPPQLPLASVIETEATSNHAQMQNTPVELFDIVWRFYIIDYNVDPPHRFFTNITPWPAHMTLRETYEDEHISSFELFIEWHALGRVTHSGLDGETYRTMIAREFKARGIEERLQIYRKIPSAADRSEITSSWDSFDGKMLSMIVLRANETVYKPLPKWARKADRKVDYYVFDVGIIREQPILREPSFQPELEAESPFKETFSTPDRNEFSDLDEFFIPDSDNNNNNLFVKDTHTLSDDDTQSVHTVSSKFTDLSLGVPKARDKGRVQAAAPSASASRSGPASSSTPASPLVPASPSALAPPSASASTSAPASTLALALTEIQRQGSIHRKRAVSGSASASSSKKVISRRYKAAPGASREGGYQTRSKDQQQ
jgi:hypothetical protein